MIRFANSQLLWLLWLVLIALALVIYAAKKRRAERENFAEHPMLNKIARDISGGKIALKGLLLVAALFFLIAAAIDPQIGTRMEEVKREGVDIIAAVDVSASMMAEDIKPNRLSKAKHEVRSFIDKLKGDRIGIIAFGGAAYAQCPLTLDYGAAKMFADVLDTSLIPVQGTAIAEAIEVAVNAFKIENASQKVLVLITDGEDHEREVEKTVQKAKDKGVIIYTVGMGTPGGAPVPGRKGYLQDKSGAVVFSKLNETLLTEIALETGGGYYRGTTGEDELDKIYRKIFGLEKTELSAKQYTEYEHRFQYFAGVALFLLMLEMFIGEKRGPWSKFFKLD
ncbi:MAG: VWA domain-containing protein [candidate division Zixibacteria bacterium]|nr:VWA domain-containing protein [Candidatus Tariuqbacter arcticus]